MKPQLENVHNPTVQQQDVFSILYIMTLDYFNEQSNNDKLDCYTWEVSVYFLKTSAIFKLFSNYVPCTIKACPPSEQVSP